MKSLTVCLMAAGIATIVTSGSSYTDLGLITHECLRPCVFPQRSKICGYKFFVTKGIAKNEELSPRRVINGTSPGPPIEICLGDKIEVIVENGLSSEELTFHWHGLRQKGSPHMDGVSMISQCPIMPYTSFRYEIEPEATGTYMYHAHSARQQGDGLYGSLTVRDFMDDRTTERILVVSARSYGSLSELLDLDQSPVALVLNGQTRDVDIKVESGGKYLLRLINANAFNCPVSFSVAKHNLDVISNDGHLVDTGSSTERIIIFPGERFDLAILTNQTPGRYVIDLRGFDDCRGLIHEAFLNYRHDDDNRQESQEPPIRADRSYPNYEDELITIDHCKDEFDGTRTLCSLDLKGRFPGNNKREEKFVMDDQQRDEISIETIYVSFDVHSYDNIHDGMTDYSFNIYDFSYYPSFLTGNNGPARIGQVNRMTFEYPPSPILSQPEAVPDDTICSIEERAGICNKEEQIFCQCTQILQLPAFRTFDIVLIDEGFGGNTSHTFHVHGYDVGIVGFGRFDGPTSKREVVELNDKGRLLKRQDNSKMAVRPALLRKDSFVVPNKGYLVLRIYTDNVGYWLWESRGTGFYGGNNGQPPMQFVMLVGNRENLPTVPIDFPKCGHHKSPASIFHDTD